MKHKNIMLLFAFLMFVTGPRFSIAQYPGRERSLNFFDHPYKDFTFRPNKPHSQFVTSNTSDSLIIRLVGRWAGGPCRAVAVSGDYAYFANGFYIEIADVSNPANPLRLSKLLLPSRIECIVVSGSYAYVADGEAGLRIINVINPNEIQEIGYLEAKYFYAYSVAVSGSYAYVAASNGLRVINVADRKNPQEVGYFKTRDYALGVTVVGNYAYVTDWNCGLRIINIANPTNPLEVGYFETERSPFGVDVSGSYAYVAYKDGLYIINIATPNNPKKVGHFATVSFAKGAAVVGNYVYLASDGGLHIINIATPSQPIEVAYYAYRANSVTVSGSYAYVAAYHAGLRIINVTAPPDPQEIAYINTGDDRFFSVSVSDSYAYIAEGYGLRIIGIENPAIPQDVSYFNMNIKNLVVGVVVDGNYAYIADDRANLYIIDVSNVENPQLVGYFAVNSSEHYGGLTVSGSYVYLTDSHDGLHIINITDPAHPQKTGFFYTLYNAGGVTVSGNYAYVADGYAGLRIINITNPAKPEEVGYFDTKDFASDVAVSGSYAYVADTWDGLCIINVEDPINPNQVSNFFTGGRTENVDIAGNYAIVADVWTGLHIIDVTDPANPQKTGYFDTKGWARCVSISGNYVYVIDEITGLFIFEFFESKILNLSHTVNFPAYALASDYQPTDYRIIGLPGASNVKLTDLLPGIQNTDWQVYWDNGAASDYFAPFDGSDVFNFSVGRAFWLIHKGPWSVTTTVPSAPLNASNQVEIPLHPGWNLITNPFITAIPWATVQQANGITQPIWSFQGSFASASSFAPFRGYYFDNRAAQLSALKIPYSGTLAKSVASENITDNGWQVQFILTAGATSDSAAWFGVSEHASKGLDRLDFRKPRAVGAIPTVYFSRPGWDREYSIFASDIRPRIEEMERWEFEVSASPQQPCQLAFSGLEAIPPQLAVYLIDQRSARRVNLRDMAVYRFTSVADISKFYIIVGKEGAVDEQLSAALPNSFSLGSNYPNPFNATTTIPVSIPIRTELSLKVYNTLGEAVKTIYAGTLEPGQYQFPFDGRDDLGILLSSGVYLYQLMSSAKVSLMGKMILMK